MFFDFNGIMEHEFLPQSHSINKKYYLEVPRHLREVIQHKFQLVPKQLLTIIRRLCHFSNFTDFPRIIGQPQRCFQYTGHIATYAFFWCTKLKRTLKSLHMEITDDFERVLLKGLKSDKKIELHKCITNRKEHWRKC